MSAGRARRSLARLASHAPVPVFLIRGVGADEIAERIRLDERLQLLDSPRSAIVLIVAGQLTEPLQSAAAQVHDQMAGPRGVVEWSGAGTSTAVFSSVTRVSAPAEDAAAALSSAAVSLRNGLLSGRLPSSPPLLPDVDPNPWRGIGPYGQGGTGMTGGVPYGRPLPGRAKDRDGLELDQLLLRAGPFLPPLPEGLLLDVRLQGDVIQAVEVGDNPFMTLIQGPGSASSAQFAAPSELAPFLKALREPVPVAEIELIRARHHLRWLAGMLRLYGLDAQARQVLSLASRSRIDLEPSRRLTSAEVHHVRRRLERNSTLSWVTKGVGKTEPAALEDAGGGPVVRAAGIRQDERLAHPEYLSLGFTPLLGTDGDARSRWRLRLREAEQSLELAERAPLAVTSVTGRTEAPTGVIGQGPTPSARLLSLLPRLLIGLEWGDAVTAIVSLDVDLREAALEDGALGWPEDPEMA